ncbi:MAG: complex I subunit 1 family protein [Candidatus Sericytochromatia bacterium]
MEIFLDILIILIKEIFIVGTCLSLVPVLVWLERKGAALIQDRIGPNRTAIGFLRLGGLIQLVADSIKMFFKEDIVPSSVNRFYYYLAPMIAAAVPLMTISIVPFADTLVIGDYQVPMQVLNLPVGILWFFAIVSLSVYGVVFAGWSSNSKFPLLGGLRASAQMLSYEIPMGLSVIGLIMIFGSVNLSDFVSQQGELLWGILPKWGIFMQPLAAIIFIVCAFAETNRSPFDLAEGESELVAGFHTEYSSMKFGLFFMGEYVAMVVSSSLITTLFLGGWQIPYLNTNMLIEHSKTLMQISFAALAFLSFFLSSKLYNYHKTYKHRWKDMRDSESLIFSYAMILLGIISIGAVALVSFVDLPSFIGPIFAMIAQTGAFFAKVFFICWVFVWVRWTLPRFRYDQLMKLGWQILMPLALLNIFLTGAFLLFLGN